MKLEFNENMVHIIDMLGIINFKLHVLHCAPTCELFENKQFVYELNEIANTLLQFEFEFSGDYSCQLLSKIYNLGECLQQECDPDMYSDDDYTDYYGVDYPKLYKLGVKICAELKDLV